MGVPEDDHPLVAADVAHGTDLVRRLRLGRPAVGVSDEHLGVRLQIVDRRLRRVEARPIDGVREVVVDPVAVARNSFRQR